MSSYESRNYDLYYIKNRLQISSDENFDLIKSKSRDKNFDFQNSKFRVIKVEISSYKSSKKRQIKVLSGAMLFRSNTVSTEDLTT